MSDILQRSELELDILPTIPQPRLTTVAMLAIQHFFAGICAQMHTLHMDLILFKTP